MSDPPCEKCGGSGYVAAVLPGESASTVVPCEACCPAAFKRWMKRREKKEKPAAPPSLSAGVSPLVAAALATEACLAAMKLVDSGSMLSPRRIADEAVAYAETRLKATVLGDLREHVARGVTGVTQAYLKDTRKG